MVRFLRTRRDVSSGRVIGLRRVELGCGRAAAGGGRGDELGVDRMGGSSVSVVATILREKNETEL